MTDDEYRRFLAGDYDPRYPRSPWPVLLKALLVLIAILMFAGAVMAQEPQCMRDADYAEQLERRGLRLTFSGVIDGDIRLDIHTDRQGRLVAAFRTPAQACVMVQGSGPFAVIIPKGEPT